MPPEPSSQRTHLRRQYGYGKITILGEGGKLIGGALFATLSRQDVEETVLEGFFPVVPPNREKTDPAKRHHGIRSDL